MTDYAVLSKRIPRTDAWEKVTGKGKFAEDIILPGMLYGKILRSPHAHARIISIDTSEALKLPGVKAIITGSDFGSFRYGMTPTTRDETPLARGKVRYIGEEVAAVVAIDMDVAEEAVRLIKVEYEPLPAVFDPEEAMQPGAPLIHEDHPGNISVSFNTNFGDIDKAFADSYYIREDEFYSQTNLHGFIEPHSILAEYDPSGRIKVWPSKQSPYFLYRNLSNAFDVPLSKVRVIQPIIGGGFGGKNGSYALDFCAVMLSKKTGRPVKITLDQEEIITAARRRHAFRGKLRIGVDREGKIQAYDVRVVLDGGAGTGIGPTTLALTHYFMYLPYVVPNIRYEGYRVYTNKPISVAQRGNGILQIRYAAEVQLDKVAEALNIDPLEIRLRNAVKPGHVTVNKMNVNSCGFIESLHQAAEAINWREINKQPVKDFGKFNGRYLSGVGIAGNAHSSGCRIRGHNSCSAVIKLHEDGTVSLIHGATDSGQGAETVLAMITAEVLGIEVQDVQVSRVDTELTPVDPGSYGSRVSSTAGNAVLIAANDCKRQMAEIAGEILSVDPDKLNFRNGQVFLEGAPVKSISFRRLSQKVTSHGAGRTIIGKGSWGQDIEPINFDTGEGDVSASYSFGTQAAEVEVDTWTGKIRVVKMVVAHDLGFCANPLGVEGQHEGSIYQGIGHALFEECSMEDGRTINPSFTDYTLATFKDMPPVMESINIETNEPTGAFGMKESGEGTTVSTVPAIVNAIHNATGIWFHEMPITPEKVLNALRERGEG